jgi:hypothetical protein
MVRLRSKCVGIRRRRCDCSLLECGGGVPEWEERDHFWNEAEREWGFERLFEADRASHRKSLGGQKRWWSSAKQ